MPGMTPAVPLPEFLLRNARIVPNRDDILPLLPRNAVIAEVGVMTGDFSKKILDVCQPSKFYALDLFTIHELPIVWGQPTTDMFANKTHLDFYQKRFAAQIAKGQMEVLAGDSAAMLESLPDNSLDVVYLDADHTYPAVARELDVCSRKLKPHTGLIVLNDYIMADGGGPYGVIQAAHEFMLKYGWEMLVFALQEYMYCDIVIRKLPASRPRRLMQRLALQLGYTKLGRF
ncbi:class I SAM-dependent methyltransferase [Acetobacter tropicalis]|uniref:Class I SAM-dependent methyltransferase n=1 Tax=Acetobacter tropicalis TaxID=104102 RepID=A0A252A8X0_9PROT|nr:class I SAM-dependent methyltransferase [Acetobacter tropicalis]OUI86028.1 hypothetical protein HC62_07635 [Acetobacter tropicalis]